MPSSTGSRSPSGSPKRTADDAELDVPEGEPSPRYARSEGDGTVMFSPTDGDSGDGEAGDGEAAGDTVDHETCYFSKILVSDVSAGSYVLPKNIRFLCRLGEYFECITVPFHMEADDIPEHARHFLRTLTEVHHCLQTDVIDTDPYFVKTLPGNQVTSCKSGSSNTIFKLQNTTYPLITCHANIVITHGSPGSDGEEPLSRRQIKFFVLYVVYPAVFNLCKFFDDVGNEKIQLRGRRDYRNPFVEKERNFYSKDYTMMMNLLKNMSKTFGGKRMKSGLGSDSRLRCGGECPFPGADSLKLFSPVITIRTILNFSAFELETDIDHIKIQNCPGGVADLWDDDADDMLAKYQERGLWREREIERQIEFSRMGKKEQATAGTPVAAELEAIRVSTFLSTDAVSDCEPTTIQRTETTVSYDLSCMYIVMKNVGMKGVEIPESIQRLLLKRGAYFESLDASSIELLNSMEAFVGRTEAEKIMHAIDKASATPTLHGNMQKRYDNLLKITLCQSKAARFGAWVNLSKDNVEQTFSRVKSKRDYVSEEGLVCMALLSAGGEFLAGMDANREAVFRNLVDAPVTYGALLSRDEYASMGVSRFMRHQIMGSFAIERFASVYNLTGMQLQLFILLLNNVLYGLLYFSQESTPSTKYGLGGPLIPSDGGGSYRKGESKYPVMDKKKSTGANNSIEKAFIAMSPRTYGFDHDFPKASDVEGMTQLALHMITSVKKIGNRIAPNQPLLELRKVIAITELIVKNGSQPGPHERFVDMMSSQIPRGSDTGLQKERTLTDVEDSKRQCVKFEKVNSPCVSFLCCNEIPEAYQERMDAIATVSRTVFTTDFRDDVGISEPTQADKVFFRCFFLDTPVVSKLAAHCQRESSVGNISKCLPTARTILDMFFAAYKATAFLQSGIQRMATTWPRMQEGAECRGTCRTFSGFVEAPSMVGGGAVGLDVSMATRVLVNFKFNPIALEVVPSVAADLFDHRLNTPLLVLCNLVSAVLKTPVVEPASAGCWLTTGRFPATFNGKRDEEKVRAWLNVFGAADRFFDGGQLWVTKNGGGDAVAGERSFASMFQNPNAENAGGDGFLVCFSLSVSVVFFRELETDTLFRGGQASVFQRQERSDLMPAGFSDSIANNLFDVPGVTKALAVMNFPGWEDRKTNPLRNYMAELVSTSFQVKGSLFSSFVEMENTGALFADLLSRAVVGQHARAVSETIAIAKVFPPTMGRGGWTMAFDARTLLLLASLSFEREDATAFHLIKPPMRTHFIKNVVELFLARVPAGCFPFPVAPLDLPGDGTNIVKARKLDARTTQGKPRTLFVRSGVQKENADEQHAKQALYTRLAKIFDRLSFFQVLPMKEGASNLSPSLHAEDSAEAEAFIAAAKYLELGELRHLPPGGFNRIARVGEWTPALDLANDRVAAYKFVAGKEASLLVSDGGSVRTIEDASAQTLAELQLLPVPQFSRVGVLLYVQREELQWAPPCTSQFSDTVAMDPDDMHYTLDGNELANELDCAFAVVVPQATDTDADADAADAADQWFSASLEYEILVCEDSESGAMHGARMGLSEVRRSLVPYGSDLLVDFSFVYCINEEFSEFAGCPWYIWPRVSPRHHQPAHLWASLSYIDEDDPRMWWDGQFQYDFLCVLVSEFSSDVERYEDTLEDGVCASPPPSLPPPPS
jgi:hypothetical protein